MFLLPCHAPARRYRRAGVFVFALWVLAACENSPLKREQSLDIGSDTIKLESGVDIHDIAIKHAAAARDFEPGSLASDVGDVLRFRTLDATTHVISFDESTLPATARDLFAAKNQLRSPPLLSAGVTWLVSLAGAPPGVYTYRCETHGAVGRVTVE